MEQSELKEKIEDGSYYKDAYEWYENKYLSPLGERSHLFVAAALLTICFTLLITHIVNTWQNVEEIPIILKAEDSTEHFSYIHSLAKSGESTQESVTKYLIKHYIRMWESYHPSHAAPKQIQHLIRQIRSTSTKQLLNDFKRYISVNNPYSPLVLYNTTTTRDIEFTSIEFFEDDPTSGKATVQFQATVQKGNEKPDISLWEAQIQFKLPDVNIVAQTGAPLRFVVRYYRAKPIKKITS